MTQDKRIEEVKELLVDFYMCPEGKERELLDGFAQQISQLFPQPSTDEALRGALRAIIQADRELSDIQLGEYEPFIYYKQDSKETVGKLLTLLQQRVEEVKGRERNVCCGILAGCPWKTYKDGSIGIRIDKATFKELFTEEVGDRSLVRVREAESKAPALSDNKEGA